MLDQLNGKYINTFLKVYELRNISKASIVLGFSQSTVTNHIQILEDTLNKKLFHRTINGVSPTEKGDIFARYANSFLKLTKELNEALNGVNGLVRLKTLESFCVTHFSKPLLHFLDQYHDVEIKLTTGFHQSIIDDVINQKIDLGIVPIDPNNNKILYTPILTEEFVFISSNRIAREKLFGSEIRIIGFGNSCIYQSIANSAMVENGNLDYKNIEYASLEMIKQTVLNGFGIALVPKCSVENELSSNKLKLVELNSPVMITHGIVELKSAPKKETTHLLKNFIIDYFHH